MKEVTQAFNHETYNYDSYYDNGAYGHESYDYSAHDYSTEGASATQGADTGNDGSHTPGHETVTAANTEHSAPSADVPAAEHKHPASPSEEHVKS